MGWEHAEDSDTNWGGKTFDAMDRSTRVQMYGGANAASLDTSASTNFDSSMPNTRHDYVRIGGFKMPRRADHEDGSTKQRPQSGMSQSRSAQHIGGTNPHGHSLSRAHTTSELRRSTPQRSVTAAEAAVDKSLRAAGRWGTAKQRPYSAASVRRTDPSVGRIRPRPQQRAPVDHSGNLGGLLTTGAAPLDEV